MGGDVLVVILRSILILVKFPTFGSIFSVVLNKTIIDMISFMINYAEYVLRIFFFILI